jgi:hypothetical protein
MKVRYLAPPDHTVPRRVEELNQDPDELAVAAAVGVRMLEEPDTNATDGSARPRTRQSSPMHDVRKSGHSMTGSGGIVIPSTLPHADIRDALAPLIGGAENGTCIPVTFAMVPEARDAMDVRYKQLVADFAFDRETTTPFGGDWDAIMCRTETLFKEISNRSLAAKHALWKGDLWLADDLINDNYFTALDARAEIHTGSNAYWDKRWNASVKASSVIADLTYTTAKQTKARSDFYSRSVPGIDLTTEDRARARRARGTASPFFGARTYTPTIRPTSPSS